MAEKDPKWIEHAHLKKGALRETAKKKGLIRGNEPVGKIAIDKLEKSKNPKTRKRASLASTLESLHKG